MGAFLLAAFAPSPQIPILHQASHFHFRSSCLAVRELLKLGYQRPALALPANLTANVRDQWVGGYCAALLDRPAGSRFTPLITKNLTQEGIVRWSREHRPDVILSNETQVMEWLRDAKRDKPVAFANLDRHPDQAAMAGIDQRHEHIGAAAVDLIVSQFNRNERGVPTYPRDVLIEGQWVDGPSAPQVPGAAAAIAAPDEAN